MTQKQQERTTLIVSLSEAQARISEQIEKGRRLLELSIRNEVELKQARNEESKWSDYNIELLRRIVDTDDLASDYLPGFLGVVPSRRVPFTAHVQGFFSDVEGSISRLESILERLPLMEPPALAQPMEAQPVDTRPEVSRLATENGGVDLIKPDLDKLSMRRALKDLIQVLIEDVNRAHHAKAYVAAVLLYRSIIEAILLGLLLRRRSKAEDPSGKDVPKTKGGVKPVEDWKLEEMIRRAVAMGLVDDTDESSIRTLQNYGNLVHAARILKKEPFIDPSEDAKIVRSHLIKLFKRYGAISE